jgi:acetyltransferase-like isoleucine patch superfamily enzyme
MRLKELIMALCTFAPSSLRLAAWRLLGHRVGPGCRVSPLSLIVADKIELGHGCVIEPFSLIYRPSHFRMGERSRIASFVRIIGYGRVDLAEQTFIALGCLIEAARHVCFRVGARSEIGPRGTYYTHGRTALLFSVGYPQRTGDITIGEDCWLGMACIVYPQVQIGDRSMIMPGTVVTHRVKTGTWLLQMQQPTGRPIAFFSSLPSSSDAEKLVFIQEMFQQLASRSRHARVDKTESAWILEFSRSRRLILCCNEQKVDALDGTRHKTVVWRLHGAPTPGAPTFRFDDLKIYGCWTPLAEELAAYLCDDCGVRFVFDSPHRETGRESAT